MIMQKKYALVIVPNRGPCFTVRWQQWANILNSTAGGETYMLVIDTDFGCGVIDTSKENHKRPHIVDMEALEWKDFDMSKFDIRDGVVP